MRIVSDNRWKAFKYRCEVPNQALRDNFAHLDDDEQDGFFQYRGSWYHVADFMRVKGFGEWDGAHNETAFSAVVLKLSSDGQSYKVGRVLS